MTAQRRVRGSPPLRRALLRRAAALALAAIVASWVGMSATRAEMLRHRWDPTVEVLVARRDLPIGTTIEATDLVLQMWPAALVPAGSLRSLPRRSTLTTAAVMEGEALIEGRTDGTSVVPGGRGAMEIESPGPLPAVNAGDRVDVMASPPRSDELAGLIGADPTEGRSTAADQPAAVVVAKDAIVLGAGAAGSTSLTLAVSDPDIAATAAALLEGPVALVVRPSPP